MTEQNAARVSLRTAAILTVFTLVFTTLMAATYKATKPAIDASAEAERVSSFIEVSIVMSLGQPSRPADTAIAVR